MSDNLDIASDYEELARKRWLSRSLSAPRLPGAACTAMNRLTPHTAGAASSAETAGSCVVFEAEIRKAVDDYAEMELKARAWDELMKRVAAGHSVGTLADLYEILLYVHHAHITSKG